MIGHEKGGLDDRILQVKGPASKGPQRAYGGLHELGDETCTCICTLTNCFFPRTTLLD